MLVAAVEGSSSVLMAESLFGGGGGLDVSAAPLVLLEDDVDDEGVDGSLGALLACTTSAAFSFLCRCR